MSPAGLSPIQKSGVLLEALPYLQAFRNKTVVVKCGGNALEDTARRRLLLEDIAFLSVAGIRPVLVHGAGPEISRRMAQRGRAPRFVQGLRVTDPVTLRLVVKALTQVNRILVTELRQIGARAQGLIGSDGRLIQAEPYAIRGEDLGLAGKVIGINTGPVQRLLVLGVIPVVAPVGVGWNHRIYNVNADEAASSLAAALKAEKFVLVTDVPGILKDPQDSSTLIPTLTIRKAKWLTQQGVIVQGMIPKTGACIRALQGGVRKTHIIDALVPHSLLLEIFTDRGIGTQIVR